MSCRHVLLKINTALCVRSVGQLGGEMKKRRTDNIKISPEAILLRRLRESSNLSIREVASSIGKSESYLRHIEKGRLDLPSKEVLLRVLENYNISYHQFKHRLRFIDHSDAIKDYAFELVKRLSNDQLRLVIRFLKSILEN